ncbi:MAG: 8-oxo-dGTP pyrophosphatase MutT (NUDIX family) [Patiriisocius sp.]|jgi:8-oxo-dGTP pyrophosphatase MutT (NUDIX family)
MKPIIRHAARAVLYTPDNAVLLLKMNLPWIPGGAWTLPGGGIDPGESAENCARREVFEETGFTINGKIEPIWHTTINFVFQNKPRESHEQYFLARVPQFEPTMENMLDYERSWAMGFKWWSTKEMLATKDHFSPRQMPGLMGEMSEGFMPQASLFLENPLPVNYQPA